MLIPTMSKDENEQLKLAHKMANVVNRASKKICVTLLLYNMDKPKSSYAQVRMFARKKEDENFQQIVSEMKKWRTYLSKWHNISWLW